MVAFVTVQCSHLIITESLLVLGDNLRAARSQINVGKTTWESRSCHDGGKLTAQALIGRQLIFLAAFEHGGEGGIGTHDTGNRNH
jgi:hypothetical protein